MIDPDVHVDFDDFGPEDSGLPGWPIVCTIVMTMPIWLPPFLLLGAITEACKAVKRRLED